MVKEIFLAYWGYFLYQHCVNIERLGNKGSLKVIFKLVGDNLACKQNVIKRR